MLAESKSERTPQSQRYQDIIKEQEDAISRLKKQKLAYEYQQQLIGQQQKKQSEQIELKNEQLKQRDSLKQFLECQEKLKQDKNFIRDSLKANYQSQMDFVRQKSLQERSQQRQEEMEKMEQLQKMLMEEEQRRKQKQDEQKRQFLEFEEEQRRKKLMQKEQDKLTQMEMLQLQAESSQRQFQKEASYRKYYEKLAEMQNEAIKQYVPYQVKKEEQINKMIESGIQAHQMLQNRQYEQQMKSYQERIVDLRRSLQQQLQEKQKTKQDYQQDYYNTQAVTHKNVSEYQQYQQYLEQQRREQQKKYCEDLANQMKQKQEKASKDNFLRKQQSEPLLDLKQIQENPFMINQIHNPLTNPMPVNIQNPYILRQLMGGNRQSVAQAGAQDRVDRVNYAQLANSNIIPASNNAVNP